VKFLRPLGHSGQERLQVVVGSKLKVNGNPQRIGFLRNWEI
jgi:hypothetical protein